MPKNTFSMFTQKSGRMKYLLLAMGIPALLMWLFQQLLNIGILPKTELLSTISIYLFPLTAIVLGYHLVMKKNHSIEIKDNTIVETDWRKKNPRIIKTTQIHCYRQNILGEIILLDKFGIRLLCVENNMTNFDAFQQWLARHDIQRIRRNKNGKSYF